MTTRINRCSTETAQDVYDRKTFVPDAQEIVKQRAHDTKVIYESFTMIGSAVTGDQKSKDKLYEIIANDFELLDTVIELINDKGLLTGFDDSGMSTVRKSFDVGKKVRDIGMEAIKSNMESDMEG